MSSEWCFVIQGPATHVRETLSSIKECHYVYSTWKEDAEKFSNKEYVLLNDKPANSGVQNIFYQQVSTLNGLAQAKSRGFKKAVKIRSDFILSDPEKLIDIFTKDLNIFFWHNHHEGYIADYIMAGDIDVLISLWQRKSVNYEFPEQLITKNLKEIDIDKGRINVFLDKIDSSNDIFWSKYNKYLSSYRSEKLALNYIP